MRCDMCNIEIKQEDGYLLTTSQVVLSKKYWNHLYETIESGKTDITVQQLEKLLPTQIQKMAGMNTDWLICAKCISTLDPFYSQRKEVLSDNDLRTIDLNQPGNIANTSPWSSGPADMTQTGIVAVAAWENKFGKKPDVSNLALMQSLKDQSIMDSKTDKAPNKRMEPSAEPIQTENGSKTVDSGLVGIRGWLILPAIGFILGMIAGTIGLITAFSMFSDVAAIGYGGIFSLELLVEIGLLIFLIYAAIRFFRKKRNAPSIIIALLITTIATSVLLLIIELITRVDIFAIETGKQLVKSVIGAAIWIPYFKRSRRVKATFVN